MGATTIDYLGHTWNPLAMRCTPCSPGCEHCWHLRTAARLGNNPAVQNHKRAAYLGQTFMGESGPILDRKTLNEPLKRKKPTVYGTQFMGDIFHNEVSHRYVLAILSVISKCPHHTFLMLTKRANNMRDFFSYFHKDLKLDILPNLWLGVTICNQEEADEKIPILLQTPAAHRWVSYEPALGPIKIPGILDGCTRGTGSIFNCDEYCTVIGPCYYRLEGEWGIDFIVAGAETGPGARPADNEWFRDVRDQCIAAGVPYFQKKCTGPTPDDLNVRELPWKKGEPDGHKN